MTYNLKYPEPSGPHAWPARRPMIAEVLRRTGPDIVGTQEGHYEQLRQIVADSGRYQWVGVGRDPGGQGEFCAVLYDPVKLAVLDCRHFWLSDTPEEPGSATADWGNRVIRMATQVEFRTTDGQRLLWLNTHLDHKSPEARRRGAALIAGRLTGVDTPAVVSGDFNDVPGSAAYATLLTAGFTDTWTGPEHGTFGDWAAPRPDGERIDWILTRGLTAKPAELCLLHDGDRWPSDHVPVLATLEL